jgi:dCTP deaminase
MAALRDGIQSAAVIRGLIDGGAIRLASEPAPDQIQPASLDLRLGRRAWRVRASFLPGPGRTVMDQLDALKLHEFSLEGGALLETGCVYIAELQESLALSPDLRAAANPKSSTGPHRRVHPRDRGPGPGVRHGRARLPRPPLRRDLAPAPSRSSSPRRPPVADPVPQGEARVSDPRPPCAPTPATGSSPPPSPSIQDGVAVSVDLSGFGPDRLVGLPRQAAYRPCGRGSGRRLLPPPSSGAAPRGGIPVA